MQNNSLFLAPMPTGDFGRFKSIANKDHARNLTMAGGLTGSLARAEAITQFNTLLPQGIKTKDHYFYLIHNRSSGSKLGYVWLVKNRKLKNLFIAYLYLFYKYRGKSLGKKVLAAIETKAKRMRLKAVGLHVFLHNTRALRLYESHGYKGVSMTMRKVV